MFVCQVDETPVEPKKRRRKTDLRSALISMWDVIQMGNGATKGKATNHHYIIRYGCRHYSRRPRKPMDVKKMIDDWEQVVITLSTAHSKEDIDKAEYLMDDLLTPILAAPIKELREFYETLIIRLRDNPAIPFFIWRSFGMWGAGILDLCENKESAKRLRKKLANEIAEMVEEDVRPDIGSAIVGALQWRNPEQLKEIKADLQAGAKPKLKGKESCLFLTVQAPGKEERQVML